MYRSKSIAVIAVAPVALRWMVSVAIAAISSGVGCGSLALGQENGVVAQELVVPVPKAPESGSTAGVDLFLLVHSPPNLQSEQLKEDLENAGLISFDGKIFEFDSANGGIVVRPISANNFKSLESLVGGDIQQSRPSVGDAVLRNDPNQPRVWTVNIAQPGNSGSEIEWIEIRFEKGRSDTELEKYVLEAYATGKPFVRNSQYLGTLTLAGSGDPSEYRVRTVDGRESDFQAWPRPAKHFFVCLRQFKGGEAGRDQLLQVLRESAIASRFVGLPIDRTVLLSYAAVDLKSGVSPRTWFENKLLMSFDPVDKVKWDPTTQVGPARVWVLFPLSDAQKTEVLDALSREASKTRSAVSGYVRSGAYPMVMASGPLQPGVGLPAGWVAPDAVLNDTPSWYEVPIDASSLNYRRAFELTDPGRWSAADQGGPWLIAIYESQFRTQDQTFRHLPIELDKSLWKVEQFREWGNKQRNSP